MSAGGMDFSVIIPIYNTVAFLRECVISVVNQNLNFPSISVEIILVNDGSTDNSLEVASDLKSIYDNIVLIDKANGGASSARNAGLNVATGKYICFIDSDDYLDPDALSYYYNCFEKYDPDVVYSSHKVVDESSNIIPNAPIFNIFKIKEATLVHNSFKKTFSFEELLPFAKERLLTSCWSSVYKKSFLDKFNIRFIEKDLYEDVPFGISVFMKSDKARIEDVNFYNYRFRMSSTSHTVLARGRRNVALDVLKWMNTTCAVYDIYSDWMLDDFRSDYSLEAFSFCLKSTLNALQRCGGYTKTDEVDISWVKEELRRFYVYMTARQRMIATNPFVFGFPKRITKILLGKW